MENENTSKFYFMDLQATMKLSGKLFLLALVESVVLAFLLNPNEWWAKIIIGLIGAVFFLFNYYDIRYYFGFRKNPYQLNETERTFKYYNEYEGVKIFSLDKMKAMKAFRNYNGIHLIEIKVEGDKMEQNINVSGIQQEVVKELIEDLKRMNPDMSYSENMPERKKVERKKRKKQK